MKAGNDSKLNAGKFAQPGQRRKSYSHPLITLLITMSVLFIAQVVPQKVSLADDIIAYDLQNNSANPPHQIYTINADGTRNAKLIMASIGLNHLQYSPDGHKIALAGYMDNTNATWSIHIYDLASKRLQHITNNPGVWDSEPAWSPNGLQIAFTKVYPSQNMKNETWVMNADGTHP